MFFLVDKNQKKKKNKTKQTPNQTGQNTQQLYMWTDAWLLHSHMHKDERFIAKYGHTCNMHIFKVKCQFSSQRSIYTSIISKRPFSAAGDRALIRNIYNPSLCSSHCWQQSHTESLTQQLSHRSSPMSPFVLQHLRHIPSFIETFYQTVHQKL